MVFSAVERNCVYIYLFVYKRIAGKRRGSNGRWKWVDGLMWLRRRPWRQCGVVFDDNNVEYIRAKVVRGIV